jgi:hypothetical protein
MSRHKDRFGTAQRSSEFWSVADAICDLYLAEKFEPAELGGHLRWAFNDAELLRAQGHLLVVLKSVEEAIKAKKERAGHE